MAWNSSVDSTPFCQVYKFKKEGPNASCKICQLFNVYKKKSSTSFSAMYQSYKLLWIIL